MESAHFYKCLILIGFLVLNETYAPTSRQMAGQLFSHHKSYINGVSVLFSVYNLFDSNVFMYHQGVVLIHFCILKFSIYD